MLAPEAVVADLAAGRRAIADLRGELPHSDAERSLRRVLRARGVLVHPRPYLVEQAGHRIGEVDVAVVAFRYGAEVDGPHHLLPEQVAADKARDRALAEMRWTIDRFPGEEVEHLDRVVAQVARRLAGLHSGSKL